METIGQVIRTNNLREGYVGIAQTVLKYGEKVSPRGQDTREFQCATIIVENPWDTLPTGVGRAIIPGIAAVESAQLLSGISDPRLTIAVSPMFKNFTEDNGLFHGAYGPRTAAFDQFAAVERRLRQDPSSRQTVVTLWDPEYDTQDAKRDYPCTTMYHFMIRKDRLHMEVVMRSNDVMLGLAYDGFQHSRVQIAMASVLGIEVGEYRHHAMSLHIYERDTHMVEKLTMPQKMPDFFPAITGRTWREVKLAAENVIDDVNVSLSPFSSGDAGHVRDQGDADFSRSYRWYHDSMVNAARKNRDKA